MVTRPAFTDHGLQSVYQIPHISCHVHLLAYMVCMSQVTLLWAANPSSRATHHMGVIEHYSSILNFSKNIVSLVHHGAYCALVVHIASSWCTSTPYTVVVVYNVP